MASCGLDMNVEADCLEERSETDLALPPAGLGKLDISFVVPEPHTLNPSLQSFGIKSREIRKTNRLDQTPVSGSCAYSPNQPFMPFFTFSKPVATISHPADPYIRATQDIRDDMIEDGAHVVFDWDNTLKLYDKKTRQLSCRVSKEFLMHLKHDRHCKLYIISAIRPSSLNLATLLSEVDRLGLTDIFVRGGGDEMDGMEPERAVVKAEYACMGNIIICGYDKAETFLELSKFDAGKGDKVMFFDDEVVNIENFSVLVPSSRCYLCE